VVRTLNEAGTAGTTSFAAGGRGMIVVVVVVVVRDGVQWPTTQQEKYLETL
jgi:hypothetical protein